MTTTMKKKTRTTMEKSERDSTKSRSQSKLLETSCKMKRRASMLLMTETSMKRTKIMKPGIRKMTSK
jgi:hypothetical protein